MASELKVGGLEVSTAADTDVRLTVSNTSGVRDTSLEFADGLGVESEINYSSYYKRLDINNKEAGEVRVSTSDTPRLTIDSAGLCSFSSGIAVTTGGVKFPATQSASADANTLDDYEEGSADSMTMAPNTSGTITLHSSYDSIYYTKVGNLVTCFAQLSVLSVDAPVGSYVSVSLPFTAAATVGKRYGFSAFWYQGSNVYSVVPASVQNGTAVVIIRLDASLIAASEEIWLSFSYSV